jgi:hypothetical protein
MSKSNGEYMTAPQVRALLPWPTTSYWLSRNSELGLFPASIRVSPRKRLYPRREVEQWIRDRFKANSHVASPSEKKPSPRPERAKRRRRVKY